MKDGREEKIEEKRRNAPSLMSIGQNKLKLLSGN